MMAAGPLYLPANPEVPTHNREVRCSGLGDPTIFPRVMRENENPAKFGATFQDRGEADLPKLRLHDLRHQFASHLVNDGKSLYEVQQILGHSDPAVAMRYAHLSVDSMRSAAESAARRLGDVG